MESALITAFKEKYIEKNQYFDFDKKPELKAKLDLTLSEYLKRYLLLIDSRYADMAEIKRLVDSQNTSLFAFDIDEIDELYEIAKDYNEGRKKGTILTADKIKDKVIQLYKQEAETGLILPSYPTFSKLFRYKHGQLNIITGVPTHGKSEWLDQMLVMYAAGHRMKFAIFSPENYPIELHIVKLVSKFMDKPFYANYRMSENELEIAVEMVKNSFFFIEPHEDNVSLESILNLTLKCHEENKIDGFVIDPWNEIEHNIPVGKTEVQYIGQALTTIRRFGRKHNISPFIVAHPTKMKPLKAGESTPVPQAYDINGGAMWYNKADNIICIYRNNDNSVDLHVQKIKFKHYGKKGSMTVYYNFKTGCYSETRDEAKNFYGDEQ